MSDQTLYLVFPYAVASACTGGVAWFAWRRRGTEAARYFVRLALVASLWSAAAALSHAAGTPESMRLWALVRYGPITLMPVAWLLFALAFAGSGDRISGRLKVGLLLIPALTMLLVATNDRHLLVFTESWVVTSGPLSIFRHGHGPWFWVHTAYSYVLVGSGILVLGRHMGRSGERYYGQAAVMVAGALAPVAANVWYLSVPAAMKLLDPTPVAFSVSTLLFAVGLFRYNLLDLAPIGRARILESMPDGVAVLDMDGRVLDCNPAAERMLREGGRIVQGRRAGDVGGILDAVWRSRDTASANSQSVVTADGEAIWVAWTVSPFAIGGFLPPRLSKGWLVQLRDVTREKTVERQLREARDQAMEHSRLKSAFLANVNHELRTPLTGILGLAEVLDEELGGDQQEFVRMIRDSGERLLHTLDALLAVSDLHAGRVLPEVETVDVAERLANVVAEYRAEARRKGLEIWLTEPAEPARAEVDPGHLEQAVRQVLDNAVKFTDRGGVAVTIARTDGGVEVRVRDTGRGIHPDFLPHVFDAFRQESAGAARAFEGTGLGLQIAQGLLERMGAKIRVESEVGVGTTVRVVLPPAERQSPTGRPADRELAPRRREQKLPERPSPDGNPRV